MTTKQTLIALAFFGTLVTAAQAECLTAGVGVPLGGKGSDSLLGHPLNAWVGRADASPVRLSFK